MTYSVALSTYDMKYGGLETLVNKQARLDPLLIV